MTNLILENTDQVPYFTNMRYVFEGLKIDPANYDWFLSDINVNCIPDGFAESDQWMSGQDLKNLIYENEIQFIWGVFSAVPIGFRTDVSAPPFADGNPDYWTGGDVHPQLLGALFEITCWDSCSTILVGINQEQAKNFTSRYSRAMPLSYAAS